MDTKWIIGALLWAAVGYTLSVFTWNSVHTFFIGAQAKITALRQQASDLEKKIRGL